VKAGWFIGTFMFSLICNIICSVGEMTAAPMGSVGGSQTPTIFTAIMSVTTINYTNIITFGQSLLSVGSEWLQALWTSFFFSYSFWAGSSLEVVRYLLMCVNLGVVGLLVLTLLGALKPSIA